MLVRAAIGTVVVAVSATISASAFFDVLRWLPIDEGTFAAGLHAAPLTASAPRDAARAFATLPQQPDHPRDRGIYTSPPRFHYIHRTRPGDTLSGMLLRAGIEPDQAREAIGALREQFDPRRLRVGQEVTVAIGPREDGDDYHRLDGLSFGVEFPHRMVVSRRADGGFDVDKDSIELHKTLLGAAGTIRSSLFADGDRLGIPPAVLSDLLKMYSWDVDFQRDVHGGDSFAILYESYTTESGERVSSGKIMAAVLTLGGERRALFRYTTADGDEDLYDENGRTVRKALLKTPIDGARLSSGFGMRRHPILGYSRMHRGVDFAAPPGTPIFAAGDGTIVNVGGKRGYGRYVKIRHRSGYATAYAHMSRYAKGMRTGVKVKQGDVIGYVGSSGLATGPHLHYEILINNRQVNPVNVDMPAGRELAGRELQRFRASVAAAIHDLAQVERDAAVTQVADAGAAL